MIAIKQMVKKLFYCNDKKWWGRNIFKNVSYKFSEIICLEFNGSPVYIYNTINQWKLNLFFNIPVLFITEKCDTAGADGIGTICECNYTETLNLILQRYINLKH